MKNQFCCKTCMGKSGVSSIRNNRGMGFFVRPIYGGAAATLLKHNEATARPAFLGKEQLATQGFYSLGQGMKQDVNKISSSIEEKLKKLTLKNPKELRKNIKLSF